jgi:phospholipid/cholesterol/gamma-HCH transport system substrate-binding protein
MENRAHALAAGLFTLLLGAALVAVALWFSRDGVAYIPFQVTTTTSVAGLKVEAPVRYRGVEVGKVESIRIDPGSNGQIHIRLGVIEGTPVTRSTYARLGYQGVTGLAYVALDDSGESAELLKIDPRKVAEIPMRRSIMDSGEDLIAAFGEIAKRVNTLLDDDNQKAVRRALVGLEMATLKTAALAEKTAALADQLQPGVAGVPGLVGDTRSAIGNANQLIGNLSGLASKIEERVEALGRVAKSVEEVGTTARAVHDETLPRLNALVDDLHKETRALDRLINALGEHPQSFVFGAPPGKPGPGEKGFAAGGTR